MFKQLKSKALVWYCRFIERQLGIRPTRERDEKLEKWLAGMWQNEAFRAYIGYRVGKIKEELAGGSGMVEIKHDDYVRYFGQRMEILLLGKRAKDAYERKEKEEAMKRAGALTNKNVL